MAKTKVRYMLKKTVETTQPCAQCNGTGDIVDDGKCRKCIDCENGRVVFLHETEIDLYTALVEMGMVKQKAK